MQEEEEEEESFQPSFKIQLIISKRHFERRKMNCFGILWCFGEKETIPS